MAEKKKKSFYIDGDLCKRWDAMHSNRMEYSVSATAAMLLWLALEDMPKLREELRRLGQGTISIATIRKARELLQDEMVTRAILDEIEQLGPEKMEFLRLLKQSKEKSSDEGKGNQ